MGNMLDEYPGKASEPLLVLPVKPGMMESSDPLYHDGKLGSFHIFDQSQELAVRLWARKCVPYSITVVSPRIRQVVEGQVFRLAFVQQTLGKVVVLRVTLSFFRPVGLGLVFAWLFVQVQLGATGDQVGLSAPCY